METDIMSAVTGLFFVLGLIFAIAWLFKKSNIIPGQISFKNKANSEINVIETKQLDTQNKLVLVKVKETEYLLGVGQHGIRRLDNDQTVSEIKPNDI